LKKIILKCGLSPGDIVMLSAAVRDLHKSHPDQFLTDVRTPCPAIWENNPYITPLKEDEAEIIQAHYPLIHRSNELPYHFIHGYVQHLSQVLGVPVTPTDFRGDIYISDQEKSWISQVKEITQDDRPFWVIVAGGKKDFTIKWWSTQRYQEVVNHYKDKITFVQVGAKDHVHPALDNVINLVGKTDLRQLIRLIYHSSGVLCPVTAAMHLAAAVEFKHRPRGRRPCVVIAGGREPSHWEEYPGHQFIHNVGSLPCCASGGCWKSRTVALGDGSDKDGNLCVDTVLRPEETLPKCMDMIEAADVIRRIQLYV